MKIIFTAIVASALAGCASVGHEFDVSAVDRFEVGTTTLEEAVRALGPYTSHSTSSATKTFSWTFAKASGLGAVKSKAIVLVFGADGRLLDKSSAAQSY